MSLKLLAIPFFVICTLVVSIAYIKPDVSLLMKKAKHVTYLGNRLNTLEGIAANIKAMQSQIATSQSDNESTMTDADFLRKIYFPISSDIEKGIDQLNFLADQSGVAVGKMDVVDAQKHVVIAPVVDELTKNSAQLLIAKPGEENLVEEDLISIHRTYTPDTFSVTIETVGSYDAMKDFYSRIVQAKRFFLPKEVTLSSKQPTNNPMGVEEKGDTGVLYSTLEIQFMFLPTVSLITAVGDDTFEKTKLDFDTLAMIRQNKQGVTPELPAANPLGKANLFIK